MYTGLGQTAITVPLPPVLPSSSFALTSNPLTNQYLLIGAAGLGAFLLLAGKGSTKLIGLALLAPGAYLALKAGAL